MAESISGNRIEANTKRDLRVAFGPGAVDLSQDCHLSEKTKCDSIGNAN